MRLNFKHSDDFRSNSLLVLDEDTGKEVGIIQFGRTGVDSSGGIDIWLFDGKYQTRLTRYDAAVGFVLGSRRSSITVKTHSLLQKQLRRCLNERPPPLAASQSAVS